MDDASVTLADQQRSHSSRMIPVIDKALSALVASSVNRLLDIGCGHGGLTVHLRERLAVPEVHGVDIDAEAVAGACDRGITAQQWDLQKIPLPYDDATFDLVVSFGALNYLSTLDAVLREMNRVSAQRAYVLVALPNLASWHNRLMLARGFQPRDVELSNEVLAGVHRRYRDQAPVGHVSGITTRAFVELMEHFGFSTVRLLGASPSSLRSSGATGALDRLMSRRPTLARRFVYLGRRTADVPPVSAKSGGWWQRVEGSRS